MNGTINISCPDGDLSTYTHNFVYNGLINLGMKPVALGYPMRSRASDAGNRNMPRRIKIGMKFSDFDHRNFNKYVANTKEGRW